MKKVWIIRKPTVLAAVERSDQPGQERPAISSAISRAKAKAPDEEFDNSNIYKLRNKSLKVAS